MSWTALTSLRRTASTEASKAISVKSTVPTMVSATIRPGLANASTGIMAQPVHILMLKRCIRRGRKTPTKTTTNFRDKARHSVNTFYIPT
mmetsp:Transcript_25285/g.27605  ORF Transcript_25285/g.27605 Transcript_25285/m.27605 type:complete len:90 (-) Transcript_25285:1258-1527(-)